MEYKYCPVCNKLIPDYRLDDPFCDCGWQMRKVSLDYDEAGWFTIISYTVGTCILQIVILFFIHVASSFALSILDNILFQYINPNTVVFFHYFAILSIDFIMLACLYFGVAYFLGRKSSHPVWLACIFGFIAIGFKLFVVDPRSNIQYPELGYILNILLLAVAITAGVVANYTRKRKAK